MTSGKDRRRALLELARTRGAKGTGSSSSTTEPIAALMTFYGKCIAFVKSNNCP